MKAGISNFINTSLNLSGRATRKEFWLLHFFCLIALIIVIFLGEIRVFYGLHYFNIAIINMFFPLLFVSIRRMHDVGKSGWFILIPIYSIILFAQKSIKENTVHEDSNIYKQDEITNCFPYLKESLLNKKNWVIIAVLILIPFHIFVFPELSRTIGFYIFRIGNYIHSVVILRIIDFRNMITLIILFIGPLHGIITVMINTIGSLIINWINIGDIFFPAIRFFHTVINILQGLLLYFVWKRYLNIKKNIFEIGSVFLFVMFIFVIFEAILGSIVGGLISWVENGQFRFQFLSGIHRYFFEPYYSFVAPVYLFYLIHYAIKKYQLRLTNG